MALTLAEIITRVRGNTSRTSDPADTVITQYINDRIRRMARFAHWSNLYRVDSFTTTLNVYQYAFPSNMQACLGMRVIDGEDSAVLQETDITRLHNIEPYQTSSDSGQPTHYAPYGRNFELYPKPDAAYTMYIDYRKWPDELSTGADTCDIEGVDDAVIAGATADVFARLQLFESAAQWESQFKTLMREALTADRDRPNWQPEAENLSSALPTEYWNNPFVGL